MENKGIWPPWFIVNRRRTMSKILRFNSAN